MWKWNHYDKKASGFISNFIYIIIRWWMQAVKKIQKKIWLTFYIVKLCVTIMTFAVIKNKREIIFFLHKISHIFHEKFNDVQKKILHNLRYFKIGLKQEKYILNWKRKKLFVSAALPDLFSLFNWIIRLSNFLYAISAIRKDILKKKLYIFRMFDPRATQQVSNIIIPQS